MQERALLLARCADHAERQEWREIEAICTAILEKDDLPDLERANWMRQYAVWVWRESLTTGCFGPARSLLMDAIPLAKTDPLLLGRIFTDMTAILWAHDGQNAARRLWSLMAKHQGLEDYRPQVFYNLGYSHSAFGHLIQAARYYRKAAALMSGRQRGWALHNLAEVLIELGHFRAAERFARESGTLLASEDRHIHASVLAYLAAKRGYPKRACAIIDAALADSECPPLAKAYLWYCNALVYHGLGEDAKAMVWIDRTWRFAADLRYGWVLDRLSKLRTEIQRGEVS